MQNHRTVNLAKKFNMQDKCPDNASVTCVIIQWWQESNNSTNTFITATTNLRQVQTTQVYSGCFKCPSCYRTAHRQMNSTKSHVYHHTGHIQSNYKVCFIQRPSLRTHQALLSQVLENHQFSIIKLFLKSNFVYINGKNIFYL